MIILHTFDFHVSWIGYVKLRWYLRHSWVDWAWQVSSMVCYSPDLLCVVDQFWRSPSYPPPGCGKSKSKLKSEQDGISKTHKLLRRTCSSTVKTDDVCTTKSHRTFGRSLSSDPRAEQTVTTIKSHKLLTRSCPAAVKQEDCLTLKSHKLLTRSCSGDPRCEHNTNLKPHKLLSRSYSSNLRMEELYGLKNHKLLSKAYSSAPKSSKTELFKEPNSEGRRLSLTSGLIGILTPSSSSSSQPAVRKCFHLVFLNVKLMWGRGFSEISRDLVRGEKSKIILFLFLKIYWWFFVCFCILDSCY